MGSWPAAMMHPVHPHHPLVLLRYKRNFCNLCGGPLVGELGYRCEPCDFDVHCTCLPTSSFSGSALLPPPGPASYPWHATAGAHAQHQQYVAQPSVIYATPPPPATGQPQSNMSLSQQQFISHQLEAQTSPPVHPAPSNHGWYHHRPPRPDYLVPYRHSYDHLHQQSYPTTNNQQGGYDVPDQQSFDYLQQQNSPTAASLYDYTGTRDSIDADDYPLDDMDDYSSWV